MEYIHIMAMVTSITIFNDCASWVNDLSLQSKCESMDCCHDTSRPNVIVQWYSLTKAYLNNELEEDLEPVKLYEYSD